MIQSAHRKIYSVILLLIIFSLFNVPDRAFSGTQVVSTSKAVFYVY